MRQPGLLEHGASTIGQSGSVATLQLGPGNSFGRVLGMQIKWPPLDLRAEPALEPRRPLKADVAEGSYVVAPHDDAGRSVSGHIEHCRDR
jgi:hypothetical protein